MARPQVPGPSSVAFTGALVGTWIGSKESWNLNPHSNMGYQSRMWQLTLLHHNTSPCWFSAPYCCHFPLNLGFVIFLQILTSCYNPTLNTIHLISLLLLDGPSNFYTNHSWNTILLTLISICF